MITAEHCIDSNGMCHDKSDLKCDNIDVYYHETSSRYL